MTSVPNGTITTSVDVRPLANLRELDTVQVLTRNTSGVPASQAIDALPPAGSEPGSTAQASAAQTASTQPGGLGRWPRMPRSPRWRSWRACSR